MTQVRALLVVLLAVMLLSACSDGSSRGSASGTGSGSESASGPDASATGEPSTGPKAGEVGSSQCSLDAGRLRFVVRDWGRVYGSIGREDHHRYTLAMARDLDKVADAAATCKKADAFATFRADVDRIDALSRRAAPDYALYDDAVAVGNEWLSGVGFGTNALSVG